MRVFLIALLAAISYAQTDKRTCFLEDDASACAARPDCHWVNVETSCNYPKPPHSPTTVKCSEVKLRVCEDDREQDCIWAEAAKICEARRCHVVGCHDGATMIIHKEAIVTTEMGFKGVTASCAEFSSSVIDIMAAAMNVEKTAINANPAAGCSRRSLAAGEKQFEVAIKYSAAELDEAKEASTLSADMLKQKISTSVAALNLPGVVVGEVKAPAIRVIGEVVKQPSIVTILEGFTKVTDCSNFTSTVKKINAAAFGVPESAMNITLADGCDASDNGTSVDNSTATARRRELAAVNGTAGNATAGNGTSGNATAAADTTAEPKKPLPQFKFLVSIGFSMAEAEKSFKVVNMVPEELEAVLGQHLKAQNAGDVGMGTVNTPKVKYLPVPTTTTLPATNGTNGTSSNTTAGGTTQAAADTTAAAVGYALAVEAEVSRTEPISDSSANTSKNMGASLILCLLSINIGLIFYYCVRFRRQKLKRDECEPLLE